MTCVRDFLPNYSVEHTKNSNTAIYHLGGIGSNSTDILLILRSKRNTSIINANKVNRFINFHNYDLGFDSH